MNFYHKITCLVDKKRMVDVIYFHFTKVSPSQYPHWKLMEYRLDKQWGKMKTDRRLWSVSLEASHELMVFPRDRIEATTV